MAEMMRVRIRGGPLPTNFVVEDMDTGRMLPVTRIELNPITLDKVITARLDVWVEEIDMVADAEVNTGG